MLFVFKIQQELLVCEEEGEEMADRVIENLVQEERMQERLQQKEGSKGNLRRMESWTS